MAGPMFPSLIPRYVDENWYDGDEPVDEMAELSKLEASLEAELRAGQSAYLDTQTSHVEPVDDDGNDDEDEEEMNEDDEDDEDEMDDGEEINDDFIQEDSPPPA